MDEDEDPAWADGKWRHLFDPNLTVETPEVTGEGFLCGKLSQSHNSHKNISLIQSRNNQTTWVWEKLAKYSPSSTS